MQECLLRERKPEKPQTPREAWPAYCSAKNLGVERYSTQTARTSVDGSPSRLIVTIFLAFKSILKKPPTRSGFPKFGRDPHHRHHARVFEPSCFGHNLFHECVGGFPLNQHAARGFHRSVKKMIAGPLFSTGFVSLCTRWRLCSGRYRPVMRIANAVMQKVHRVRY